MMWMMKWIVMILIQNLKFFVLGIGVGVDVVGFIVLEDGGYED